MYNPIIHQYIADKGIFSIITEMFRNKGKQGQILRILIEQFVEKKELNSQ